MADGYRSIALLVLILALGAAMRLGLAGVNPPNNSYDDHLEPIALYAAEGERPAPQACWQCYQPPVYYAVSATVLAASHAATENPRAAWEAVQWMSAVASIGTLILVFLLLRLYLPEDRLAQAGGVLALAILPRDLYTAASMGNDALFVFFVTAAVYCFARFHRRERGPTALVGFGASVLLAAWTKQSGLLVLGLVGFVFWRIWKRWPPGSRRTWILSILLVLGLLALGDEAWRTYQTGIPLASNQHFDYRAALENQPPGHISASTFTSFLPVRLFEEPTLHSSTVDSFWTQIFARTWYDYEPRFLPIKRTTIWLARSLYVSGVFATMVILVGLIKIVREGPDPARKLLFIPVGFITAAIFQTVRFPHFSSMKAVFVLPGVSVFALCFAYGVHTLRTKRLGRRLMLGFLLALALIGAIHWWETLVMNPEALNTPTSPQWPFPPLGPSGGP